MSTNIEIPNIAAAKNDTRASLAAVRTPWSSWQTPLLQTMAVAVAVCWFFMASSIAQEKWSRVGFPSIFLVLWVLNTWYRERAWLKLIKDEAPELYKKIEKTDADLNHSSQPSAPPVTPPAEQEPRQP